MPSGGHASSGPMKDLNSVRSAGVKLIQLPSEGYRGEIPDFPLPKIKKYDVYFEDKKRVKEHDADTTEAAWQRELEIWEQIWRTPQAQAWARESWRWPIIALYVRTFAICEGSDATAADKGTLHRLADQIGMTPAGLQYNHWQITRDAVADRREETQQPAEQSAAKRFDLIVGGSA